MSWHPKTGIQALLGLRYLYLTKQMLYAYYRVARAAPQVVEHIKTCAVW